MQSPFLLSCSPFPRANVICASPLSPPPWTNLPASCEIDIREHPLSTYAPWGRGGCQRNAQFCVRITLLREKRTRGGEGVKKAGKSAYVLYGCSLKGVQIIGLVHKEKRITRDLLSTKTYETKRDWSTKPLTNSGVLPTPTTSSRQEGS